MTELICPKCGKTSDQKRFIEAFCVDCYPVNIKIPREIIIDRCKNCGKVRIRGEWMPHSKKAISEYVASKCRGDFESAEYNADEGKAIFTIVKDNEELKVKRNIYLEIRTVLCKYCSRMSGGYFEGLIQLRGNQKKVEKYANMLIRKLEKRTFITKVEEKGAGLDLYVGSSKAVVELISQLKIKVLMTKKLVGVQQGKKLYRTTFAIRL